MKKIIVEIDGERHRMVIGKKYYDPKTCEKCSLYKNDACGEIIGQPCLQGNEYFKLVSKADMGIWLARDRDGRLYAYNVPPRKGLEEFEPEEVGDLIGAVDDSLHPEVTWENSPKELVVK